MINLKPKLMEKMQVIISEIKILRIVLKICLFMGEGEKFEIWDFRRNE